MTNGNGYPSLQAYKNHFGTFNNVLEIAEFKLNKIHPKLDGTEKCSYCGKRADEIPNFTAWRYDENGKRYCNKHGQHGVPDYVKGELDINSNVGLGRAGEILVAKVLNIGKDEDCNRISCGYKYDLKHDDYKKIDVKTRLFEYKYNCWKFGFNAKKDANTYICIGLSSSRKEVKHVWIVPNEDKTRDLIGFCIHNTYRSLSNRSKWEVDAKKWNEVWKNMSLDNCKIMIDKNKDDYVETVEIDKTTNNATEKNVVVKKQYILNDYI